MDTERHRVEWAEFQVSFRSGDGVRDVSAEVVDALRAHVLPAMERALDQVAPADTVVVVDGLELDLGVLPEDEWPRHLAVRLEEEMLQALRDAPATPSPGPADAATRRLTRRERDLEILGTFLRTGRLPWRGASFGPGDLDAMVSRLVEEDAPGLVAAVRSWGRDGPAAARLVRQFPETVLAAFLAALPLTHPERVVDARRRLRAALVECIPVGAGRTRAEESFLEHLIRTALATPGVTPTRTALRMALRETAWPDEEVARMVKAAVSGAMEPGGPDGPGHLEGPVPPPAADGNRPEEGAEASLPFLLLLDVLHGSAPAVLEPVWSLLTGAGKEADAARRALRRAGGRPDVRRHLARTLPRRMYDDVLRLLAGEGGEGIPAILDGLSRAWPEVSSGRGARFDPASVREDVLRYLVEDRPSGTTLSSARLVADLVGGEARRRGVPYGELLAMTRARLVSGGASGAEEYPASPGSIVSEGPSAEILRVLGALQGELASDEPDPVTPSGVGSPPDEVLLGVLQRADVEALPRAWRRAVQEIPDRLIPVVRRAFGGAGEAAGVDHSSQGRLEDLVRGLAGGEGGEAVLLLRGALALTGRDGGGGEDSESGAHLFPASPGVGGGEAIRARAADAVRVEALDHLARVARGELLFDPAALAVRLARAGTASVLDASQPPERGDAVERWVARLEELASLSPGEEALLLRLRTFSGPPRKGGTAPVPASVADEPGAVSSPEKVLLGVLHRADVEALPRAWEGAVREIPDRLIPVVQRVFGGVGEPARENPSTQGRLEELVRGLAGGEGGEAVLLLRGALALLARDPDGEGDAEPTWELGPATQGVGGEEASGVRAADAVRVEALDHLARVARGERRFDPVALAGRLARAGTGPIPYTGEPRETGDAADLWVARLEDAPSRSPGEDALLLRLRAFSPPAGEHGAGGPPTSREPDVAGVTLPDPGDAGRRRRLHGAILEEALLRGDPRVLESFWARLRTESPDLLRAALVRHGDMPTVRRTVVERFPPVLFREVLAWAAESAGGSGTEALRSLDGIGAGEGRSVLSDPEERAARAAMSEEALGHVLGLLREGRPFRLLEYRNRLLRIWRRETRTGALDASQADWEASPGRELVLLYHRADGLRRRFAGDSSPDHRPSELARDVRRLRDACPGQLVRVVRELATSRVDAETLAARVTAEVLEALVEGHLDVTSPSAVELRDSVSTRAAARAEPGPFLARVLLTLAARKVVDLDELVAPTDSAPSGRRDSDLPESAESREPGLERLQRVVEHAGLAEAVVRAAGLGPGGAGVITPRLEALLAAPSGTPPESLRRLVADPAARGSLPSLLREEGLARIVLLLRPASYAEVRIAGDVLSEACLREPLSAAPDAVFRLRWEATLATLFSPALPEPPDGPLDVLLRAVSEGIGRSPSEVVAAALRLLDEGPALAEPLVLDRLRRELSLRSGEENEETPPRTPARRPLPGEADPGGGAEGVLVDDAGLVLAAPYLPRLFEMVGLLAGRTFRDEDAAVRGVQLLRFLVTGTPEAPEFVLFLDKLLCGVERSIPIPRRLEPSDAERDAVEGLLAAMLGHWSAMANTSVSGFRESFLQREGVLRGSAERWELEVEERAFDVLLDTVPWGFRTVALPWMSRPLHVDWR